MTVGGSERMQRTPEPPRTSLHCWRHAVTSATTAVGDGHHPRVDADSDSRSARYYYTDLYFMVSGLLKMIPSFTRQSLQGILLEVEALQGNASPTEFPFIFRVCQCPWDSQWGLPLPSWQLGSQCNVTAV